MRYHLINDGRTTNRIARVNEMLTVNDDGDAIGWILRVGVVIVVVVVIRHRGGAVISERRIEVQFVAHDE